VGVGSASGWKRRIATAWLLALALLVGSLGQSLAGPGAYQASLGFGDEICHAPGAQAGSNRDHGRKAAIHDCCLYCQGGPAARLAPPPIPAIGPTAPPTRAIYAGLSQRVPEQVAARHKLARAPPTA
jgi:hypothetical protein